MVSNYFVHVLQQIFKNRHKQEPSICNYLFIFNYIHVFPLLAQGTIQTWGKIHHLITDDVTFYLISYIFNFCMASYHIT